MSEIIVLTKIEVENLIKKVITETFSSLDLSSTNIPLTHNDFMDINETANFLKLAKQTLYSKVHARLIPHFKEGKRLYFSREELTKWIISNKVKTIEEIESEADNYIFLKRRKLKR